MIDDAVYSLLDIDLETGRFHQIRSQMAHHGHPLYGDTKYGELKMNPDFFLGLFAYQISFNHPISDERMTFNHKPDDHRFLVFDQINSFEWRVS